MATVSSPTRQNHHHSTNPAISISPPSDSSSLGDGETAQNMEIQPDRHRFPFCIVWTPIPLITWLFPFVGHMGIATSRGVIRDFAGSYYVSEDEMAFGWPTRYWQLSPTSLLGGAEAWDRAVADASDEYKSHVHNIFCDNCHSHVALALNGMKYGHRRHWNMVHLAVAIMFKGKFIGVGGFLKQWLPSIVILLFIVSIVFFTR